MLSYAVVLCREEDEGSEFCQNALNWQFLAEKHNNLHTLQDQARQHPEPQSKIYLGRGSEELGKLVNAKGNYDCYMSYRGYKYTCLIALTLVPANMEAHKAAFGKATGGLYRAPLGFTYQLGEGVAVNEVTLALNSWPLELGTAGRLILTILLVLDFCRSMAEDTSNRPRPSKDICTFSGPYKPKSPTA